MEEPCYSPSPSTKKGYRKDQARCFLEVLSERTKDNRLQLQQGRFWLSSKEMLPNKGDSPLGQEPREAVVSPQT